MFRLDLRLLPAASVTVSVATTFSLPALASFFLAAFDSLSVM